MKGLSLLNNFYIGIHLKLNQIYLRYETFGSINSSIGYG